MQVDRPALKKLLMEQHGLSDEQASNIAMRGRITIEAVVHRHCERCGGATVETAAPKVRCTCPEGPMRKIENRGVVSDSGPRKVFPRLLWRAKEAIKRRAVR
jgi:hypothetical protein